MSLAPPVVAHSSSPAPPVNPYISLSHPARAPSTRSSRICSFTQPGPAARRPSCTARTVRPRSRSPPPAPVHTDQSSCPPSRPALGSFVLSPPVPITLSPLTDGPRSIPCVLTSMLTLRDSSLATSLRGQGFSVCEVCQLVLSLRFNGRSLPVSARSQPGRMLPRTHLVPWRRRFSPATDWFAHRYPKALGTLGPGA